MMLLTLGGTLNGAGNLTISGLFTWSGGTMSDTGITTANGGISITTPRQELEPDSEQQRDV